jgi:hypothetical protein
VRVRLHDSGLLTLIGAQIDSVTVDTLPKDVEFDVAIRIVGAVADFQERHELQAELTAPDTETIGELTRVIEPRAPAPTALPGYEINHQFGLRISFEADVPGGYDLRLRLDDKLQSLTNSLTLSVISP